MGCVAVDVPNPCRESVMLRGIFLTETKSGNDRTFVVCVHSCVLYFNDKDTSKLFMGTAGRGFKRVARPCQGLVAVEVRRLCPDSIMRPGGLFRLEDQQEGCCATIHGWLAWRLNKKPLSRPMDRFPLPSLPHYSNVSNYVT